MCLHFIWNLHKSLYNTDLILTNNIDVIEAISNNMKKHIANMRVQVPFGSTQAISDSNLHALLCNLESFKFYYNNDRYYSLSNIVLSRYNDFYQKNLITDDSRAIFILEKDMPLITYSFIHELLENGCVVYFNAREDYNSMDTKILYNFLKGYFPLADDSIYDKNELELNRLYLI